jgi:hypothetical protein
MLSSEKYKKQAHEIIKFNELSKSIFNFVSLVRKKENSHPIHDYLERKPDLSGSIYLRYLYYFYRGVYHFNNNQYATAEKIFQQTKRYFQRNSLKYLIKIYELNTTEDEKVIQLLDYIEKNSDDNLTYRSMELRKKYNIN